MTGTVRATLIVRHKHELDGNGEPTSENWGEYDFASCPRVDDFLEVRRNDEQQVVHVKSVRHFGIQHPFVPSQYFSALQRKEPSILITAEWHWTSDL